MITSVLMKELGMHISTSIASDIIHEVIQHILKLHGLAATA